MSRRAVCPDEPPTQADQPQTRRTASCLTPIQTDGSPARDRRPDLQKRSAWRMIRARSAAHPRSVPCAGGGAVTRMRYSPEAVEEAGKTAGANVVPIRPVS
jgi:hypothetical protein